MSGRGRVLVVEDEVEIRELLVEALELGGYAAAGAANGREALERLRAGEAPPCAILLDLTMPVMNGWELARELRSDPVLARIPLLVLTARSGVDAEDLGAAAAVAKPVGFEELMAAVSRVCGSGSCR
jgi:CheY-like chemotaxis protein